MPRRRISVLSSGLRMPGSSMARKGCNDRAGRMHLVTQRRRYLGARWHVQIHPRTEANKAEALTARESIAFIDIAEDASRDEPGDLHASDVCTPGREAYP